MQPQDISQQGKKEEVAIAASNLNVSKTEKPEEKPKEEKLKTKEVVQLTDDYIRMLETYLDNQDYKIRPIGRCNISCRFGCYFLPRTFASDILFHQI